MHRLVNDCALLSLFLYQLQTEFKKKRNQFLIRLKFTKMQFTLIKRLKRLNLHVLIVKL